MTIRIALLALEGDFDRGIGEGVQTYMHELYKNFKGMEKESGIHFDKMEHKVHDRIGRRFSFALNNFFASLSGYDIAHSLTLMPMYNIGSKKTTRFMTAHDFQFLFAPELTADKRKSVKGRLLWSKSLLNVATRMTLGTADYLMCNSTQTRDEAVMLGFPRDHTFVASHGIDDRYMSQLPARKRNHDKHFKIGYIGAFRTRKNAGFAVRGFMKTGSHDLQLEMWGNPKFEYASLLHLASHDKRISFEGFAPENKLVEIYDGFDAFVFPSYYEGEGLEILEAQARGLPVIIYGRSRIPKEIRKHCMEADDEEHLAALMEELRADGYSDSKRKAAMAYARTFTWRNTALGTLDAYRKALGV